ncbi:MAG: hypothetical protein VKJ86_01300 [Synechococcus sp.]|nr:hypothetical protein [Synechococcus sp.]
MVTEGAAVVSDGGKICDGMRRGEVIVQRRPEAIANSILVSENGLGKTVIEITIFFKISAFFTLDQRFSVFWRSFRGEG